MPKLPAPNEEDLSKGILEAIDMDSYRVEKQAAMKIQLPDEDAEIEPVPTTAAAVATSPSRNSTASPTSSRPSTTSSATSPGPTPTACTS